MPNIKMEIKEYLRWLRKQAPSAANSYYIWLYRFDRETNKNLSEIRAADLHSYLRKLSAGNKRYSEKTLNNCRAILRSFFKYCERRYKSNVNHRTLAIEKCPATFKPLTKEDYSSIIAQYKRRNLVEMRDELVLRLLWESGIRVEELCSLGVADIDIKMHCAYIMGSASHKRRWVVWSKETNALLRSYLYESSLDKSHYLIPRMSGSCVAHGSKLYARAIQRIVRNVAVLALGKHKGQTIVPQSFRIRIHQEMIKSGLNSSFIKEFLGYKGDHRVPEDINLPKFVEAAYTVL